MTEKDQLKLIYDKIKSEKFDNKEVNFDKVLREVLKTYQRELEDLKCSRKYA